MTRCPPVIPALWLLLDADQLWVDPQDVASSGALIFAFKRQSLESLYWRASHGNPNDCEALLAYPDVIDLPLQQIVNGAYLSQSKQAGSKGFLPSFQDRLTNPNWMHPLSSLSVGVKGPGVR